MSGNKALEEQLHPLRRDRSEPADACEEARPVATASGPNSPNAIYPPACGPMQLVWAAGSYGTCVLGTQCDSFHVFGSRQEAADWLRAQARRIEVWDKTIS